MKSPNTKNSNSRGVVVSSLLCLGIIVGCSGGSDPTNCLTQAEVNAALAAAGIDTCYSNVAPCAEATFVDTFVTESACAFYHPESECGGADTNGCNTLGNIQATKRVWECHSTSGGSSWFETCYRLDEPITFTDTYISCSGTTQIPCAEPPSGGGETG